MDKDLGATISSGHKFLRALKNAQNADRDPEWETTRKQLIQLENSYRLARNAFEHLDESILRGETVSDEDFSFSLYNKLYFKNRSKKHELDFSPEALGEVNELWNQTTKIIRTRKEPLSYLSNEMISMPDDGIVGDQ